MAFGGNTTWYVSSAKYAAITAWATGQAKAAGALIRQSGTPSVGNERVWVALNAGTTGGGSDPLTTFTRGVKITDNDIVWQECTGLAAINGDLTNTPNWVASRAVNTNASLGHVVKDAAGTHIFICSVSGTVGASEPSWDVGAVGNTTVDNGATWVYLGTSFGNWAAPGARAGLILTFNWASGVGQTIYVGSDHAETQASALSWNSQGSRASPNRMICVDVAGSVPPVSADLLTTATISTTGGNGLSLNGFFKLIYGITFSVGTSGSPTLETSQNNREMYFENCAFKMGPGTTGGAIKFGRFESTVELKNCTLKFVAVGQGLNMQGKVIWCDTPSAIDASGSVPTNFFYCASSVDGSFLWKNLDLSFLSGTKLVHPNSNETMVDLTIQDCKLPSSVTIISAMSGFTMPTRVRLLRSGSAGVNVRSELYDYDGALTTELTAVRTGGAEDDVTLLAWKIVTTANVQFGRPFWTFPVGRWNGAVAADVVATIYGIINAAAVPNDDELWINVDYLGAADSPLGSLKTTKKADALASAAALAADTSAWDGVASARANITTYALGDSIKLASNPGRLFFCTTAGETAGSEPAGYATAVDGDSITDGAATFRAGCRFKMVVTLTSPQPQIAGNLYATVKAAKPSTTYYVDPYIELS